LEAGQLEVLEQTARFTEKYGLSVILLLILLGVLFHLVRLIVTGSLVPRELLDRAEEERDRLQAILDKEREGMIGPLLAQGSHERTDSVPESSISKGER
jgi:hypothetical protein